MSQQFIEPAVPPLESVVSRSSFTEPILLRTLDIHQPLVEEPLAIDTLDLNSSRGHVSIATSHSVHEVDTHSRPPQTHSSSTHLASQDRIPHIQRGMSSHMSLPRPTHGHHPSNIYDPHHAPILSYSEAIRTINDPYHQPRHSVHSFHDSIPIGSRSSLPSPASPPSYSQISIQSLPAYGRMEGDPSNYHLYHPVANTGFNRIFTQPRILLLYPIHRKEDQTDWYFDHMMPEEIALTGRVPEEQFEKEIKYINALVKRIRRLRIHVRRIVLVVDALFLIGGAISTYILLTPLVLVAAFFFTLVTLLAAESLCKLHLKNMRWIDSAKENLQRIHWELNHFKAFCCARPDRYNVHIKITYLP